MNFDNLPGAFGNDIPTEDNGQASVNDGRGHNITEKLRNLSPENWVDIVCCTIIGAILIAVFCNWELVMSTFFMSILFPVIKVLAKILGIVAGVLCAGGLVTARIGRRRRWYW